MIFSLVIFTLQFFFIFLYYLMFGGKNTWRVSFIREFQLEKNFFSFISGYYVYKKQPLGDIVMDDFQGHGVNLRQNFF